MGKYEIEERIKIICEEKTWDALKRYFKYVKDCKNFEDKDKKDKKDKIVVPFKVENKNNEIKENFRKVLWDRYYFSAILIVPYSIKILHRLTEERDFIIFSQRLYRHRIYSFNWCEEGRKNPAKELAELIRK